MASLNKAIIIGNLGKDPEIRATPSGQSVATFSVATSEKYKNKSGEMVEQTEWHKVVLWGRLADIAQQYLVKGKTVYIEGRIQTRKWEGKDGHDRYTTEIVGETMKMLGGKGDRGKDDVPFSTTVDDTDFDNPDAYPF
ncbi:MAG TPA: single-stranded DNA-binding protein [Desulfuromonadales bacterium]|nr:single-stranded DNA-binding protein [Desulfuromonadales bacterium]